MHPFLGVAPSGALVDIGRSLREAFYMLWDTLWALVFGFGISGAVQAFVPRPTLERQLGSRRPASIVRAAGYGMISSSCSYAASAMARTLFLRGADFVASLIFMVASTNLVIELGIVLAVLIGWQFVAAEFVGGAIMIVLLATLGSLWFRGRALAEVRTNANGSAAGGHDTAAPPPLPSTGTWRHRIRSTGGWADAAAYTLSDVTMLRREMAIGFLVAGFLTVLVPVHVWADVFVQGHGAWTSIENAVVGPLVALASFVCSIGNVPLAAALWHGGVSFGGVVAFVFADLIAFPLLLVYRKQYGWRTARRMLLLFWTVMSAAGLLTELAFRAAGWIPAGRRGPVVGDTLRWGWTTYLDLAAILALGVLFWLYRHRDRLGGGTGYAEDPVCGMQVDVAHAPASTDSAGHPVYFCSDRCLERFAARHPGRPDRRAAESRP